MTRAQQPNVGGRIRAIRAARGLSLRALARQSGLSLNAISLIERGDNSPTVSSLHQIAGALGVPITDLFRDDEESAVVHTPAADRPAYRRGGMTMESLGTGLRDQTLQPFIISLEPSMSADRPVTHPGQELVYCLSGTVDYTVNGTVYQLASGDSLLLDASQPHLFSNGSDEPATFLIVFQANDSSELGRERHLEPGPSPAAP